MKRDLTLFVLLAVNWQLWSGHTEPLILAFGLLSCILVTLLSRRRNPIRFPESGRPKEWPKKAAAGGVSP